MVVQPGPHGLGEHDQSGVPPEEIRFGVVMNGGVSLAVWMGGVALELDRLVKAAGGSGPYADLLRLTGCTARVDVVSGTSAGGVNGAALALAQVNRFADLASLRDVWVEQGRIEALLRQPFRGAPSSLLKGDDHFLPQLNAAMSRLAEPLDAVPASVAPMDLTMATTVLGGNQEVTVDALGQRLAEPTEDVRARTPAARGAHVVVLELVDEGAAALRGERAEDPCHRAREGRGLPHDVCRVRAGGGCVRVDEQHDPANGAVGRHPLDGLDRRPGRGVREHAAVDGEP